MKLYTGTRRSSATCTGYDHGVLRKYLEGSCGSVLCLRIPRPDRRAIIPYVNCGRILGKLQSYVVPGILLSKVTVESGLSYRYLYRGVVLYGVHIDEEYCTNKEVFYSVCMINHQNDKQDYNMESSEARP